MKILLFDVEVSPNIAYTWGKYEQDVLGDFIEERMIISFAWKWLGEKEVYALALPMFRGYKNDPKNNRKLIARLHELFSRADIIVAHNGDEYDIKMANVEFVRHGFAPPPPHKTVDTLKVARRKFRFNSAKLNDLGKRLGLGTKLHTGGFDLWVGCLRGDKKAWAKMVKYNIQDVVLLEKVYLRLRPWMTNHPNVNALDDFGGCPHCKSERLIRQGWLVVGAGKKQRFQCKDCQHWCYGKLVESGWKFR